MVEFETNELDLKITFVYVYLKITFVLLEVFLVPDGSWFLEAAEQGTIWQYN